MLEFRCKGPEVIDRSLFCEGVRHHLVIFQSFVNKSKLRLKMTVTTRVELIGRLGDNPTLRDLKTGERKARTTWHTVEIFGKGKGCKALQKP